MATPPEEFAFDYRTVVGPKAATAISGGRHGFSLVPCTRKKTRAGAIRPMLSRSRQPSWEHAHHIDRQILANSVNVLGRWLA